MPILLQMHANAPCQATSLFKRFSVHFDENSLKAFDNQMFLGIIQECKQVVVQRNPVEFLFARLHNGAFEGSIPIACCIYLKQALARTSIRQHTALPMYRIRE